MLDLIARLEKAAKPDRALDIEIGRIVQPDLEWHREATRWMAASYTASIDAALTLVPQGRRWYAADSDGLSEDKPVACVFDIDELLQKGRLPRSVGATPAIAICIAALKDRAALTADKRSE